MAGEMNASNARGPVRRQHFVPRHYLRQFSYPGTEQISLARIEPYLYVPKATIARQCQEDYFYGEDGSLEDLLRLGEDDIAPVLVEVCRKTAYNKVELGVLRFLVVLLHVRTRKAAEVAKIFPRRVFAEVTQAGINSGKLPPAPEDWNPELVEFSGIPEMLIYRHAIPCWLEIANLECKLLRAPLKSAFVTSDNPVLLLNQFAEGTHPLRRFVGFAQSGFQLLLPISPTICLYLYDCRVYKVGKQNRQVLDICDSDVNIINTLQLQSADVCLYFNNTMPENRVHGLIEKYKTLRKPVQDNLRTLPGRTEDEQFLHLQAPPLTLPRPWTFSRIQNPSGIKPGMRRDPIWTAAIWKVMEEIEAGHPPKDFFDRMEQIIEEHQAGNELNNIRWV